MCVVLSAQGDTTDDLIAKAEEINPNASKREMDMLLACGEQMSDCADGDGQLKSWAIRLCLFAAGRSA